MNPGVPIHGVPEQKMNAKPQSQKVTSQIQVSAIPSTRMLTVSREPANPDSSITNPTCMQNTRYAATKVHTVFIALICEGGSAGAASAQASLGRYHLVIKVRTIAKPTILASSKVPAFQIVSGSRKASQSRS